MTTFQLVFSELACCQFFAIFLLDNVSFFLHVIMLNKNVTILPRILYLVSVPAGVPNNPSKDKIL